MDKTMPQRDLVAWTDSLKIYSGKKGTDFCRKAAGKRRSYEKKGRNRCSGSAACDGADIVRRTENGNGGAGADKTERDRNGGAGKRADRREQWGQRAGGSGSAERDPLSHGFLWKICDKRSKYLFLL